MSDYVYVPVPVGYCGCGCGENTNIRKGRPNRFIRGHNTPRNNPLLAFWSRVDVPQDHRECWEWQGGRTSAGYGQFKAGGETYYAHRYSCELHHGPIPQGMQALHSCDNPTCVNPGHLRIGSQLENMRDKMDRGRHWTGERPKGEGHHAAKMTKDKVLAVRAAIRSGATRRELADRYDVSLSCIDGITSRRTWRHVA